MSSNETRSSSTDKAWVRGAPRSAARPEHRRGRSTPPAPVADLTASATATRQRIGSIGRLAVVVMAVIVLGLAAGLKGRGVKSRLVRWFLPNAAHVARAASDTLPPVAEGTPDPAIRFEKIELPQGAGAAFTCVAVGPDHRLYAGSDDGRIFRFPIHGDGTVGEPVVITSLQKVSGGKRLLTGFCFDPASTPAEPVVWACHGYYAFHDAPDFSGRITRLSGPELQTAEDAVVGLPRSAKDHLNNQPVFGPDGALYFAQGSNSAFGAPDAEWQYRPERKLSASVLRLDVTRLTPGRPIDVTTPDGGWSYDPAAPGAPLTIYASGVRNAYDLVWASNGRLYVPVNGSNPGGCTPGGPDGTPPLSDLPLTEDDWLLRITPGRYYGHPNPQQGHFVLNGGRPRNAPDPTIVPQYPTGTAPDREWDPPVFAFGPHVSADGIIEYHGNAFGGRLDRKLLVCRFNVGSDLICLGLGPTGDVISVQTGIAGAGGFVNPLDLAEDLATGNLYVAEYGAKRITLLRPSEAQPAAAMLRASPPVLPPNVEHGRRLFAMTCIACHGINARGLPNLGPDLTRSQFIASEPDETLAAFIKSGRDARDPQSVTHLPMPANGGNPGLDDSARRDLVAYLRWLQAHGGDGNDRFTLPPSP